MTSSCPELDSIVIKHGSHKTRADGMCVMEVVALVAGEPHSDKPACACPALTRFAQALNDRFRLLGANADAARTEVMRPLIPLLVGSKPVDESVSWQRAWFLVDRAVRELRPMAREAWANWYDRVGRPSYAAATRDIAAKLRAVPAIVDRPSAAAARDTLVALGSGRRPSAPPAASSDRSPAPP